MRLPFEFAPPGTDPTQQKNQIYTHKRWTDAIPWIGLLVALCIVGYMLFFRGEAQQSQAASAPTGTPAATQSAVERETARPTASLTGAPTETTSEGADVNVIGRSEGGVKYRVLLGDAELWCTCGGGGAQPTGWSGALQPRQAAEGCEGHRPEECR